MVDLDSYLSALLDAIHPQCTCPGCIASGRYVPQREILEGEAECEALRVFAYGKTVTWVVAAQVE